MKLTNATINRELGRRLREVRIERYGTLGEASLADELGLPAQTWRNYESGVAIPGVQLLQFIELTGTHPVWLLRGSGDRYLTPRSHPTPIPGGTGGRRFSLQPEMGKQD